MKSYEHQSTDITVQTPLIFTTPLSSLATYSRSQCTCTVRPYLGEVFNDNLNLTSLRMPQLKNNDRLVVAFASNSDHIEDRRYNEDYLLPDRVLPIGVYKSSTLSIKLDNQLKLKGNSRVFIIIEPG